MNLQESLVAGFGSIDVFVRPNLVKQFGQGPFLLKADSPLVTRHGLAPGVYLESKAQADDLVNMIESLQEPKA